MRYSLTVVILIFLICPCAGQRGGKLLDNTIVHEIRLYSNDPDLWIDLEKNYEESLQGNENVYNNVSVNIDGIYYNSVGLRIKGYYSAWGTSGYKKPFRIDFDEFVKNQEYDGLKKISLNNVFQDNSCMRDMLAYNIMRNEGIAAPRTAYTKIFINDNYWGLYVIAEQIDKVFLKNHFKKNDGNLYKCTGSCDLLYIGSESSAYKAFFELKTNESTDNWTDFIDFVKSLNKEGVTDEAYKLQFPQKFDIPYYLKILAIDILLLNWDSYYDNGRNFYIYSNPENNKMTWIPWDYNLSFSRSSTDIFADSTRSKPLIRNLLKDPETKHLLIKTYEKILKNNFTKDRLFPIINQTKLLIREDLANDPNSFMSIEDFDKSLEYDSSGFFSGLKGFIERRISEVNLEIEKYKTDHPYEDVEIEGDVDLLLYPNPAHNFIMLTGNITKTQFKATIRDITGKIIFYSESEKYISIADLERGMYILEINSGSRRSIRKFVKHNN